ncbi:nucleotidyltransferase [uncultured Friedmanniella sp.]|uniref:SMODS domain-containing nucleotidyltransferase n=1 Tax=uncultured Friedmanniella sp. TaxID=335381 RepID=UPI0035C9BD39
MATLATLFVSALSNIQPGDDAKNAPMAHKQVSDAITSDELLRELGADPVLIGSYKRDVSIRRVKDVDVFVRLKNADDSLRPGDILTHTIEVLEDAFPGRVTRQHRSAMVDFPKFDLSVDVVIARPCGNHPDDHWQIPQKIEQDGRASWVETNPTRMTELKTQANQQFLLSDDDPTSGAYVPVVKLVRQIRRAWDINKPGGFYFEVLAYQAFQDEQPNENTVADYLTAVLRAVADALATGAKPADPTLEGRTISTSATTAQLEEAASRMDEAATLADEALKAEDTCLSAAKWRQLLGTTKHTDDPEHASRSPTSATPTAPGRAPARSHAEHRPFPRGTTATHDPDRGSRGAALEGEPGQGRILRRRCTSAGPGHLGAPAERPDHREGGDRG